MTDDSPDRPLAEPIEGVYQLDEATLRRPGWSVSRWVVLANAQRWALPRLGPIETLLLPEIRDMILGLPFTITDDETDPEFWHHQLRIDAKIREIGVKLICLNYRIGPATARALSTCLADQDGFNSTLMAALNEDNALRFATSPYRHDSVLFPN